MNAHIPKESQKEAFLNACQKSTVHAYDKFKFLLMQLKDVDYRKEGYQLLQALLNEFRGYDNKEHFLHLYHFSFHELTTPIQKDVEKKLCILQFPSIFSPEEWSFTFYNALSQYSLEEFHHKKIVELGSGNGWVSIVMAQDYMPEKIYALDINPKAKVCGEINLFLNALDSEGEIVKDREGKSILDRVVFHTSDLLTYSLEQKHKLDCVIGCIPQVVLSSNKDFSKANISENAKDGDLHSLSNYYTPEGYEEDRFGLGLVVKSLEQAKECLVPNGKMVLNMGGRPGKRILDEMFHHRGFKSLILYKTKIRQAQDTDIKVLIDIEQSSSFQFEFFVEGRETAISAVDTQQYLIEGQDIFHKLFVYELTVL